MLGEVALHIADRVGAEVEDARREDGAVWSAGVDAGVGLRHYPGMSITAIVQNDTVKLPIHVPDGTKVEITLPAEEAGTGESFFEAAREYIGIFDGPRDLSTHPRHLDDFGR